MDSTESSYYNVADKYFLEKQEAVLQLFKYVNQPNCNECIGNALHFEGHWDQWSRPEYAKEFHHYFKHGILPKGEVFSVFHPEQLKQAAALFRTLYYAKDYDTFYKVAGWARQRVNEGMFIYALSVAVIHSKHTSGIVLPPIYEISPHYFFNCEVIRKAQQYSEKRTHVQLEESMTYFTEDEDIYKAQHYSENRKNVQQEQSMTYFTQDVGLNSYYYYHHIITPFWMLNEELLYHCEFRGEYFYHYHQQLLARYYLERLSNGFGEIPHFDYKNPIRTGFYPSLQYPNGLNFPIRPKNADMNHLINDFQEIYNDYERRLRDAVHMGFFYTPEGEMVSLLKKEGFNALGMLIEGNFISPNSRLYGDLTTVARHLLGFSDKKTPSALEHFETSLRDPIFYQMLKRIMHNFYQHQTHEGPYKPEEVHWAGVKVEGFHTDRLVTFFDHHYSDLNNAITADEKQSLKIRQSRLNHKPFTYKIRVSSEKTSQAFVKIFIGPKYDETGDEIDIALNRLNFFELDRFHCTLQPGDNSIERNSNDSIFFAQDRTSYTQLQRQVRAAMKGGDEFRYFYPGYYFGFPQRYMLPKGDLNGKPFQFYVIVAPYHSPIERTATTDYLVDIQYSISYPFDRPVDFAHDFFVQNSYCKEVLIYHENIEADVNNTRDY